MVVEKRLEVPPPVPLHRRGQGAPRLFHYGGHQEPRDNRAVRIAADHLLGHDLLAGDYGAPGRVGGLDCQSQVAPQVSVPLPVGSLHVDDGDVGPERAHRQDVRAAKWVGELAYPGMVPHDIAAKAGEGGQIGHAHGSSLQCEADAEVAVVFHRQRSRDAMLECATECVPRATCDVAYPGRDHPSHGAGANQLVKGHVGDRADQGQVFALLADDLVDRCERDA